MVSQKEISSTDRLLNIIRRKGPSPPAQKPNLHAPGPVTRSKQHLIPSSSRDFIGVEIFKDSLNLVRMVRRKSGWRVNKAMIVPFPEGMDAHNPEFAKLLKRYLQDMGAGRKVGIWLGLPASRVEIWKVRAPKVKKGLSKAVYWSARKIRDFDPSQSVFDYRIKGESTEQGVRKVLAEASIAPLQDVELYKNLFQDVGYPLQGMTMPSLALENLFLHRWAISEYETYAVLYIAQDCSYIVIMGAEQIFVSRVVKTGEHSILDELSAKLDAQDFAASGADLEAPEISLAQPPGSSREQAVQVLKSLQAAAEPDAFSGAYSSEQVFDMVRPVLQRLARQLEKSMDHSVNVLKNPAPGGIYICGGIAHLPQLPGFFQEQLGVEVELLDVLQPSYPGVSPEVSALQQDQRLALASTVGLAMPAGESINFLHTAQTKDRERAALRMANTVAAGCALLVLLIFGYYWWLSEAEVSQVRQKNAQLEQKVEAYSPELSMTMLSKLAGELKQEYNKLQDYSHSLLPVAVITELNQITPEDIRLFSLELNMASQGPNSGQEQENMLVLHGFIQGSPALFETQLTNFLLRLRRSPLFSNARIQNNYLDNLDSMQEVYKFILNITVTGRQ